MKFKVGDIVKIIAPSLYSNKVTNRIAKIIKIDNEFSRSFPYKIIFLDNRKCDNDIENGSMYNHYCDNEIIKISKERAMVELL